MEKKLNVKMDAARVVDTKIAANLEARETVKAELKGKNFTISKTELRVEDGKVVITNPELVKALSEQGFSLQGGSPIDAESVFSIARRA